MINAENKYSEILKKYTFEQLVYESAILKKEKTNSYIKEKELEEEFKRRLEEKK
ncbi:MAG: hypothetical protein HFJ55_02185 [Clostridia bacterium]|nr:hypothetical protein [Clostridia bacterium]